MRFMMLMIPKVYQGRNVAPDFAPSADAVQNMTRSMSGCPGRGAHRA